MRRRAVLAGLLGLVGGAAAGLLAAMLLVYLWFDVFHLPAMNDDPKPGIAMLGYAVPILAGLGAAGGATLMVRRVRTARATNFWAAAFAVAILVVVLALFLIVN
ncbi:hypothetical protein F1C10_07060 [Sphingomonas sp. NBWT7]|uniref:hypothetical protein n=1 Tax=Sphingomonas sp. NBWT7 TaxID=2596913 RepID=UPI00162AA699|nr:hypothetical protein [Sphingomonas sp. NBWT7]QNE31715.1 hypothetical protein F1C10_07060 [Sphingomonas sp. NBWT7]